MCPPPPQYQQKVAAAEAAAAQNRAAESAREQAEIAKRKELEARAQSKAEDVEAAVSARDVGGTRRSGRQGAGSRAGGAGRRSLFTSSSGGAGYASRF